MAEDDPNAGQPEGALCDDQNNPCRAGLVCETPCAPGFLCQGPTVCVDPSKSSDPCASLDINACQQDSRCEFVPGQPCDPVPGGPACPPNLGPHCAQKTVPACASDSDCGMGQKCCSISGAFIHLMCLDVTTDACPAIE
jgi:hypothetical protein